MKEIYLAGGCFWGLEAYLRKIVGVKYTEVGYSNGKIEKTDYETIKDTDHSEAVYVKYDPEYLSLSNLLLYYYSVIDPVSVNKQGNDEGRQYRTGIYYTDEKDVIVIEKSLSKLQEKYEDKLAIELEKASNYVKAEEYHQVYLDKNPNGYCHIDILGAKKYIIAEEDYLDFEENIPLLTQFEKDVTLGCMTEPPHKNKFFNFFEKGIYVDKISGEPLFLSNDKFQSGCGWPSFTKPIADYVILYKEDNSLIGRPRIEVVSRASKAHLGHVFDDGPKEHGGLRYCINSAAITFVPYDKMTGRYEILKQLVNDTHC